MTTLANWTKKHVKPDATQTCTCGAPMTWRDCDWCAGTGWVDGVGYCAECDANGGWWQCSAGRLVQHGN
jgi:hypothetical protein